MAVLSVLKWGAEIKNFFRYLSKQAFCWLDLIKIDLETKYIFTNVFEPFLQFSEVLCFNRVFELDLDVQFSEVVDGFLGHVEKVKGSGNIKNFERLLCFDGFLGTFSQATKDALYNVINITKENTTGHAAASGALGQLSTDMVKKAVRVPYACNAAQQQSIYTAIDDRFLIFEMPGKRVSHPQLKFLTEFLDDNLMKLNMIGKKVKVLGPKFDKKEVEAFEGASDVHYCTKYPAIEDKPREISSRNSLRTKVRVNTDKILELETQIVNLRKEELKKPGSGYTQEISDQISALTEKRTLLVIQKEEYEEELKVIGEHNDVITKKICNVGAENCTEEADVLFAMHSMYDMDLKSLIRNAMRVGVEEIYATINLPFGLLYVDSYFSPELAVYFRKSGKGFLMTHGTDLSNGYAHEMAEQIMDLMKSSFIEVDGKFWAYEIVDSIAEICKLRFTEVNKGTRIVRKLMPPKFDAYTVILNPLEYFGKVSRKVPMLVEEAKIESAIKFVKRTKNNKEIIENTYAHVQALFMKVVVGNTELQAGGSVDSDMEDAIVLAALIEGNIRKHILGNAYKRSLNSNKSLLNRAIDAAIGEIQAALMIAAEVMFPKSLLDFVTKTKAERYISQRVHLAELVLDTRAEALGAVNKYINALSEGLFDGKPDEEEPYIDEVRRYANLKFVIKKVEHKESEKFFKQIERVYGAASEKEMKKKNKQESFNGFLSNIQSQIEEDEDFCLDVAEETLKDVRVKISVGKEKKGSVNVTVPSSQTSLTKQERIKEMARKETDLILKEIDNRELGRIEKFLNPVELLDGIISNDDLMNEEQAEMASALNEENIENSVDETEIKFSEHNPESVIHIHHMVDDLSKAAFEFNKKRAADIKNGKGKLSESQVKLLIKKFTKEGEESNLLVSEDEAKEHLSKLIDNYNVDASTCNNEVLVKLKKGVLKVAKDVRDKGALSTLENKRVTVINGYAGSGKTRKILQNFNPATDSYISPLAQILFEFSGKLKESKKEEMSMNKREDMLKTFEKLDEIKRSGGTLYIDESSKFSFGFLLLILAYTSYDHYVFVGDVEQTGHYDPTGLAGPKTFIDLVGYEKAYVLYYTFRFGPTVAALNNTAFNYPVFSLKSNDTTLTYDNFENFNSSVAGTNITITTATQQYIKDDLGAKTVLTATAAQGITVPNVNLVMRAVDETAAVSFRSNGIVATTRAEESLHIFIDHVSKRSKARKNFEVLRENYAQMFDIVLPSESDF